ncbi:MULTISPECIES: hypothetical protein [unclassified Polaribacter]|uniref:PGAP1-like alpha/beta domain-containing protein n=1 Tax=unclassified Polaribacter TaxID=196858 RepID=UPI0011BEEA4D|nr:MULTISPECIES: hypothetical protein [unclassified Polaribacter]TXD52058.1 hypothetical protein ES043_09435 [Polaribacter sp. IC063]TXD59780.1 hypothetical protein ES044_08925 [Polaribacter sp. IC066]
MYDARATPTNKHIALKDFNKLVTHYQNQGTIPVGFLHLDFTQFTNTALTDLEEDRTTINLLATRNRATTASPYENKHLFLASPITESSIKTPENTPVNFQFGTLGVQQATTNITTLQVMYNNVTKTIIQNGTLTQPNFSFSFTSSGLKILQFKAILNNNQQLISNATINITIQNVLAKSNAIKDIFATQAFRGYDEPTDCNGNCFGKGEYQVFLGDGNTQLTKPLIILDGFDPGDERKIREGEGSIVQLIDNDFKEKNMKKFSDEGFDVVILNFPKYEIADESFTFWHPLANQKITVVNKIYRDGGADYVERNANVLKALINKLNGELATNGSTEKLKIIGPSMGGLISRVALTQMEQANQNHNTDIWVSFDSPHLGANIPIGLQYFFNFMELDQIEMLKSPAARQMLITQVVEPTYITRNTFKNLLNTLGFPQQTRNLALINGSTSGSIQGTPKGVELDLNVKVVGTLFGSLGRYKIKTFATHNGGRHKIFERYKRITFFKNTKSAYLIDNSGRGSLDNAPGGTFDMKNTFEEALGTKLPLTNSNLGVAVNAALDVRDGVSRWLVDAFVQFLLFRFNSSIYLNLHQGLPSFIPTKSALAFTGTNKLWRERLDNRNLVCTGEIPFDSYYAPNNNEEHITLNSNNIPWVLKELNGNPQQPNVNLFKNDNINGDLAVCDNKTNTYTLNIPNTCSGFNVTWSSSNNIDILYSTNNSVTVKPINGTSDIIGHISAYVVEKNITLDKVVWVGVPDPNFLSINVGNSYNFYANQWTKLRVIHPAPPMELMGNTLNYGLTYEWSVPNSQVRNFSDTSSIDVNPYSTGQLNVGVKMYNQCGCTDFKYQMFNVTSQSSGGGGGGHTIIVKPRGN